MKQIYIFVIIKNIVFYIKYVIIWVKKELNNLVEILMVGKQL